MHANEYAAYPSPYSGCQLFKIQYQSDLRLAGPLYVDIEIKIIDL